MRSPSSVVAEKERPLCTTWLLVRAYPSGVSKNPDPIPPPEPPLPDASPRVATAITAGPTVRATLITACEYASSKSASAAGGVAGCRSPGRETGSGLRSLPGVSSFAANREKNVSECAIVQLLVGLMIPQF